MNDIVFVTGPDLGVAVKERLVENGFSLHFHEGEYDADTLSSAIKAIDPCAIVVRYGDINEAVIASSKSLKVIANHGAGYDNIDVKAATRLGIPVFAARARNAISVAEHCLTVMLMLIKNIKACHDTMSAGGWRPDGWAGAELSSACIGLLGGGDIARKLIHLLRPFGMEIRFYDPYQPMDMEIEGAMRVHDLDALLSASDVLSLHVPCTPETTNLIDEAQLAKLPKGAIVINAARGEVLDDNALVRLIDQGHLDGAALDTFTEEPLSAASPLRSHPRIIVTPHTAGVTVESVNRMGGSCASAILHRMRGHDAVAGDLVNPDALAK